MAATKSTKKAKASKPSKKAVVKKTTAKKPTAKKTTAKKTKKIKKTQAAKAAKPMKGAAKVSKPAKKSSVKKTSVAKKVAKAKAKKTSAKKSSVKKSQTTSSKSVVASFLADVVKQAHKAHKAAQMQTKTWIKSLNAQDKELGQLHKKHIKAQGTSKSSLDAKISKLQDSMSNTRTQLLNAENEADKIVTFIEWTTQLHSKPAIGTFLQSQLSPSRPTLVKSNFPSQEEYPEDIEEEDDDMNFVFGEDDEDMDESSTHDRK